MIDDAAARLGVSRRTVYYRISAGQLQTIRTLCGSQRVLLSSIDALLRQEPPTATPGTPVRDSSESEPLPVEVEAFPGDA